MENYCITHAHKIKKSRGRKCLRILCAFLCFMLLSTTLIGCDSYASNGDVSALQRELDDARDDIDSISADYAAALQEIAALKSAREDADKAFEDLSAEYESTKEKLGALESNSDSTKQELDMLGESYQSAQQEINSLKDALDESREEIEFLKYNYGMSREEIEFLKGQIEDLESIIADSGVDQKIRIYIDQGHNPTDYHNSGASGNGLYEQDLTFAIGKLLAELLKADGRFLVRLSRPTAGTVLGTDNDSSLDARVQGAIDFKADYFISLHINSYTDSAAHGIEVYTANQEGESYSFGNSLLNGLIDATELRNRGMKLGPNLRVLKNATMPAVLLEMGFISNEQDAKLLSTSPNLFANGIYNGILAYFGLEPNDTAEN